MPETTRTDLPPWEPTVEEEAALDDRFWDDRYAEPEPDYDTAA